MQTRGLFLLLAVVVVTAASDSKRGLVIVNAVHEQADLPKYLASPLLKWVYNYSPQPPAGTYPFGSLSFVPMLWGKDNSESFLTTIQDSANYSYVLTFNEPDMPKDVGGSALTVDQAVTIWKQQIQPLSQLGYKLGAPGVASTPNGAQWLSSFFSQCTNCTIDFITAHFYGPANGLEGYLTTLHGNYTNLPIWVTEFGYPDQSTDQVVISLNETITFLDNTDWVQRYAYFCNFRQGEGNSYIGQNGAVWDDNGDITAVGKMWLGLDQTPSTAGSVSSAWTLRSSLRVLAILVFGGSALLI